MNRFLEILKVIFLGIVEGVTEWLPVSSTGHMLLIDEFLHLNERAEFKELFFILVQLGAVLAVPVLFWDKMWPFQNGKPKKETFALWLKVILACIPGAVATLLFDDFFERTFHTVFFISSALIFYGILFLFLEKGNKKRKVKTLSLSHITFQDAFLIGLFQVLSIIPGTSRSGSTILGALFLGIGRTAAAEFTFFLAVPVMAGYSLLKLIKIGFLLSFSEVLLFIIGAATAFLTSLLVISFLLNFVKKHSFSLFGIYRILLGAALLLYFNFGI